MAGSPSIGMPQFQLQELASTGGAQEGLRAKLVQADAVQAASTLFCQCTSFLTCSIAFIPVLGCLSGSCQYCWNMPDGTWFSWCEQIFTWDQWSKLSLNCCIFLSKQASIYLLTNVCAVVPIHSNISLCQRGGILLENGKDMLLQKRLLILESPLSIQLYIRMWKGNPCTTCLTGWAAKVFISADNTFVELSSWE